jgi:hypothetical protein
VIRRYSCLQDFVTSVEMKTRRRVIVSVLKNLRGNEQYRKQQDHNKIFLKPGVYLIRIWIFRAVLFSFKSFSINPTTLGAGKSP